MKNPFTKNLKQTLGLVPTMALACGLSTAHAANIPDPKEDVPLASSSQPESSIVLAGGCFWGVQAVFQHVKGVTKAVSGYAGGMEATAHYQIVGTGMTGHAESVQVTYDPSKVTLGQILKVYFSVAHDPTQLNFQGPDHGSQYRSTIFYHDDAQKKIAESYIRQLNAAGSFSSTIVTTLEPLKGFYAAEDYHQDYFKLHPENPYIVQNDAPKVASLKDQLPNLYTE